jgi:hypothetical protein
MLPEVTAKNPSDFSCTMIARDFTRRSFQLLMRAAPQQAALATPVTV